MFMDQQKLQQRILEVECRFWAHSKEEVLTWVKCEGSMHPEYLHLVDEVKQVTNISTILNSDAELVQGDDVLPVLRDFYADLYKNSNIKNHEEVEQFLESLDIPMLLTKIAEGEIMSEEVSLEINKLKPGKAPGSDGLTAAFYKKFAGDLAVILAMVFNAAFKSSSLSISQRIAIIILLYKKG